MGTLAKLGGTFMGLKPAIRWVVGVLGGLTVMVGAVVAIVGFVGHGGYSTTERIRTTRGLEIVRSVFPSNRPLWAAIVVLTLLMLVLFVALIVTSGAGDSTRPKSQLPTHMYVFNEGSNPVFTGGGGASVTPYVAELPLADQDDQGEDQ